MPLKIKIASPCSARWQEMKGDQRTRFCEQCSHSVHDLSSMSAAEASSLFHEKEGRLCVRVYQRADGTVLHGSDCPVGVARCRQRMRALWGAGLSVIVLMLSHVRAMAGPGLENSDGKSRARDEAAIDAAKAGFRDHLARVFDTAPPTLGVPLPQPPTPVPAPTPKKPVLQQSARE